MFILLLLKLPLWNIFILLSHTISKPLGVNPSLAERQTNEQKQLKKYTLNKYKVSQIRYLRPLQQLAHIINETCISITYHVTLSRSRFRACSIKIKLTTIYHNCNIDMMHIHMLHDFCLRPANEGQDEASFFAFSSLIFVANSFSSFRICCCNLCTNSAFS